MIKKDTKNVEELLMSIPAKMCRNMDKKFVERITKDISKDIAKHHFMILNVLLGKDKLYVSEIVQILEISKSQMTASIDKLIQLGFIERLEDPNDRRKVLICIREKGTEITELINKRIQEYLHENIQKLEDEEIKDLERGLIVLHKFCLSCEEKSKGEK